MDSSATARVGLTGSIGRWILLGCTLMGAGVQWVSAQPRLALQVSLDPHSRSIEVVAQLDHEEGLRHFQLDPGFEVTSLNLEGQAAAAHPPHRPSSSGVWTLPAATRRVTLRYRGLLEPTPDPQPRQSLQPQRGTAAPQGSFLPSSANWYPDPGEPFRYAVELRLPAGQKGLVAGELLEQTDSPGGWRARFDFPHPARGIDLMAGPYLLREQPLELDGRRLVLRSWFHADLDDLAPAYLADSARYLQRYSRLIGPYPFDSFSVVSSPTPTGFGMPGLTYLGRDVIRLPFIRATSLGHEVLHNWWGNGVYPDWRQGNWSEGLTTFLADHAYKEDEGEDAAREMRMDWLRDYAAVPPAEDFALRDFRSRHDGIASIIGYNKSAMVFLMLRDRIGRPAFESGLRLLWERHRFRSASWRDLEQVFSETSGQPLREFFRTWVEQPGAPPHTAADPDYRVWRRVEPGAFPPILREVWVARRADVLVLDDSLQGPAAVLAGRVLDAAPPAPTAAASAPARLILGLPASVDAWLAEQGLPQRPFPARGTAQVWAGRDRQLRPHVVVSAQDADALQALQRALPHYGRQSWLVFNGARVIERGIWR